MPSYALPPWIQAADPAAQFVTGIRTGASIGEAQARLAQQQEEARMRAQARQEQLAADMLQAKTRLDYENAYHQQNIALQKQRLEDLQSVNAAKTEEAASKWAAQQGYSTSYQAAIGEGKTPEEAHMRAILENPKLISPQMLPKALHSPAKWMPADPTTGEPAHWVTDTGQVHVPREAPKNVALRSSLETKIEKTKQELDELRGPEGERPEMSSDPETSAAWERLRNRLSMQQQLLREAAPKQEQMPLLPSAPVAPAATQVQAPAAAQSVAPVAEQAKSLPSKKEDLVRGDLYMTRRGPARWDGEKFVKE